MKKKNKHKNKLDRHSILRYCGSVLIVIGYFLLLNVDVFWGVLIRLIANVMFMPWAIKNKIYDFIVILSFFIVLEVVELINLLSEFSNTNII